MYSRCFQSKGLQTSRYTVWRSSFKIQIQGRQWCYWQLTTIQCISKLFPGMPDSVTKNSSDHGVCLVAYNKEEINHYHCCMLKVNYSGKTMLLLFYVVSSKFKPIIGLDASSKLGLLTIPIHQSWTSSSPTNTSFDAISGGNLVGNVPNTLTKDWIVNYP